MSKGIGNVSYIRQGSQVTVGDQPNWGFLYQASTVRDERFFIGDRVVTPDGRAFRFSLAGVGGVLSGFGAAQSNLVNISALAPAQVADATTIWGITPTAGAIGSQVVTVTIGAAGGIDADGAVLADSLRGGYIVIGNQGSSPVNRGIVGNTAILAAAGGGPINVYLDAPLTAAVTAGTTYIEVLQNPYSRLRLGQTHLETCSFLGVPAITATVGQYFWLQTWGPTFITPGGATTPGDSANDRMVYFVGDGSVNGGSHVTYAGKAYQPAGFMLEANAGSGGPPMVNLMVNP